jgi:hypothetical protein
MSSSIYDPNIDLTAIFNSYLSGLKDESVSFPKTIQALYDNAVKHGSAINPKKVVNSKFVRDSSTVEINPAITALITNSILSSYPSAKILDVVKTTKIGGGSSGLTRYQVLMTDKGITRHLEMKEQKRPSIYPIATAELPDVKAKIFDALHSEQGPHASSLYGYAKIENMEMFIRPIFMGNIGVNLSADPQENYDKVNFEAFTLGQIHRLSVSNLDDYIKALQGSSFEDWKSDVGSMTDLVRQKYKTIHP